MHVTLVSPFDPRPPLAGDGDAHVGGVERVMEEISKGLVRRGHEVSLLCSSSGERRVSNEAGVAWLREQRLATILRAPVARLASAIPRDTDVVHVPATYPFTTPFVLHRARRRGIASVLDFQFEPVPVGPLGPLAAGAYRRLGPRTYSWATGVLVRSRDYGKHAPSLAGVSQSRWHVIPNGIDVQRFRPRGRRRLGDDAPLLFVGRLVPYKGLHILLRALALSRLDRPLWIVGDGPLRGELEQTAKRLGVKVRFLGRVPDESLPDLYRQAALTILPSVNRQEAFGITLLESMACGTPVVASNLPGVRQLARRGGVTARPGDAVDLAARIRFALETRHLRQGRALAKSIHAEFGWETVHNRLVDVYAQVVASARGG